MDDDDNSVGGSSLEEPLFDDDQEISDVEHGDQEQPVIEGAAADQSGAADAREGVDGEAHDPPAPHLALDQLLGRSP